ncbi:N-alpha-acetyltransferase 35, NatC auxiliary subunit isoform X2 [Anthonomus grandis grandis]|uniref:N-alpha-acetyltransferase 35, NatC auxiliary subunit isoform X2 n=1 Tax=Anthonomus grandis grandis TaxID=2921223 RepID=UPI0021664AE7|nr:N-alpha-acetyltransferase 35, NatC auxiliary subunit isoform X2 [Anthonomus grandis grandis]
MENEEPPQSPDSTVPSENPTKSRQNWVEISDVFKESVKDLQLGELLHDDLFGLFEAMSAIEMMDPKMDAGMLCNRGARKITSFEQAVSDELLPLNDLPASTLLGIIDGTLARLVSWLEGHSLAQTVFTCLYLHRPYAPQDRALKVFCLAVYKLLDVIKDLIHKAMVYEEEDFQPMQYGFHLTPDISEQRMVGMLREVEEELHRKSRNKQSEVGNSEAQAIFARIKFVRIFLQVLNSLRKEDQQQNSLNDCQRLLSSGIEMLQTMKDTVYLGVGAKEGEEEMACFEPSINQRLLPPTFPRYTKIKKREEAMAHFMEMLERFKVVCKAQGLTSFHQAVELFADFSQSGPCLVSRSSLQLVGKIALNTGSSRESLREAIRTFCGPHALSSRAPPAARLAAENFLARAARPAALLLQLSGHNRARQRDKLAMLLEEFAMLQEDAERADAECALALGVPPRPHFATWALYHTLRAQALYLLAGFELELYAEHEYYYIYWADSLLQEAWNGTAAAPSTGKGGRRQKPNKAAKRPRPHARDAIRLQALQQLAGGYFKALLGILREGLIHAPLPGFDRERVRFEHRFAAFTRLSAPPSATYRDFRTAAQAAGCQGSEPLFLSAGRHFAQAGQLLAAGGPAEIPLARTSKTNFVLLRLLAAGHRPKIKPTFCFNESRHFPVFCLTEAQLTHE